MHEKHSHNPGNENEPNQQEASKLTKQNRSPHRPSTSPAWPTTTTASCTAPGSTPPATRRTSRPTSTPCWPSRREPAPKNAPSTTTTSSGRAGSTNTTPIDLVARIARGIAEHGYAFRRLGSTSMKADPDRLDDFPEAYLGHYDSVQDYADQITDDLGYTDELAKLPESLQPYLRFDTEALAYDMEISGDIYVVDNPLGGVWIFHGNT